MHTNPFVAVMQKTALHRALEGGYVSSVEPLVEQKAGLDIQDNEGVSIILSLGCPKVKL